MKINYIYLNFIILRFIFLVYINIFPAQAIGSMDEYCASPSYISQTIAPNVMVVVDNSGSMCESAYDSEKNYDPTQFSSGVYYGYFDGSKKYIYDLSHSVWVETDKSINSGTVNNPVASGSFLNWLTMLRNDIVKRILIGGKANPRTSSDVSISVKLLGEAGCSPLRSEKKIFKRSTYADYISSFDSDDNTPLAFWAPGDGDLYVYKGTTNSHGSVSYSLFKKYNITVDQGSKAATGIIDSLADKVRFGLAFYNSPTYSGGRWDQWCGGYIARTIDYDTSDNIITSISNIEPTSNTPLAETLYEIVRYFRQDSPLYSISDYTLPVSSANFTSSSSTIYRDPYAYHFTKVDSSANNVYVPCAKSFVLFLTDGESTQDTAGIPGSGTPISACSATNIKACSGFENPRPRFAGTAIGQKYEDNGTDYIIDVAYWARTTDMRPGSETDVPTSWRQSLPDEQHIYTYPVFMFGSGSALLKDTAIYGGFDDKNGNGRPDCLTSPAECYRDSSGDGIIESDGTDLPRTYYEGNDGYTLEKNIKEAISDMIQRASSGTGVSVLGSSEGSGASSIQALYYPTRQFSSSTEITWTSDLINYWYYLDPYYSNAQIRQDTVRENADYTLLDFKNDYITSIYFDSTQNKTLASQCQDTDGDGTCDTKLANIAVEDTKAVWKAGFNLWWTETADRNIYTHTGDDLIPFTTAASSSFSNYLGLSTTGAVNAVINFVRGTDQNKLCATSRTPCSSDSDCGSEGTGSCETSRSRTVPMSVCSTSRMPCSADADCTNDGGTCVSETHVWKLGDIISSTPRIMGPTALNSFNSSVPTGYADTTYAKFIQKDAYKARERVFVGANDGMFHAFRLGNILQKWSGRTWYQHAKNTGTTGTGGIGTESWAFIPKNVLPYLQYLSKPDYCHLYLVDGPVTLTDASVSNEASASSSNCTESSYWECAKQTTDTASSWETIVIGSMGLGGGTCKADITDGDRVTTPFKIGDDSVGWSSYFALDVSNQDTPALLWEFSNPALGVTNIGPAVVKVGTQKRCVSNNNACSSNSDCGTGDQCVMENGRWFAILASGATGPISSKNFKGTSDQHLKLFILDLKTGELLRTIDTGIANAFAGSMSSSPIDLEKSSASKAGNYSDDVVYIGYVKNTTQGGVLRLVISDDIDPDNWTVSKVIDNIGPVTTSVSSLLNQGKHKLWLYFGEGRYFYKQDDLTTQRRLYGIQDPCYVDDTSTTTTDYDVLPTCSTSLQLSDLTDNTSGDVTTITNGWYITLDTDTATGDAERVITNPTVDTSGDVYYVTFIPTSNVCDYGGTTYTWAVDYQTGGAIAYALQGKALLQLSTGAIEELDLSSVFTTKNNRRSVGYVGVPPTGQGIIVITAPRPTKKFMHVQEE